MEPQNVTCLSIFEHIVANYICANKIKITPMKSNIITQTDRHTHLVVTLGEHPLDVTVEGVTAVELPADFRLGLSIYTMNTFYTCSLQKWCASIGMSLKAHNL